MRNFNPRPWIENPWCGHAQWFWSFNNVPAAYKLIWLKRVYCANPWVWLTIFLDYLPQLILLEPTFAPSNPITSHYFCVGKVLTFTPTNARAHITLIKVEFRLLPRHFEACHTSDFGQLILLYILTGSLSSWILTISFLQSLFPVVRCDFCAWPMNERATTWLSLAPQYTPLLNSFYIVKGGLRISFLGQPKRWVDW